MTISNGRVVHENGETDESLHGSGRCVTVPDGERG
jgi:hypothetical protein